MTTITDLPNEILMDIFRYLDTPSRMKLRLNKRLDLIQLSVMNNMTCLSVSNDVFTLCISMTIEKSQFSMQVLPDRVYHKAVKGFSTTIRYNFDGRIVSVDFVCFEQGLRRLALNTLVHHVFLEINEKALNKVTNVLKYK